MKSTTTINPKALDAISLFCGKAETRYALQGVLLEVLRDETRLVATDGHILGCYRDTNAGHGLEHGQAYTAILAAITGKQLIETYGKNCLSVSVEIEVDCHAAFVDFVGPNGQTTSGKKLDGRYPDWIRIMPSEVSGIYGHYTPESLLVFAKAAKALGDKGAFGQTCMLYPNGDQPAIVKTHVNGNFSGVIMPCVNPTTKPGAAKPDLWWAT